MRTRQGRRHRLCCPSSHRARFARWRRLTASATACCRTCPPLQKLGNERMDIAVVRNGGSGGHADGLGAALQWRARQILEMADIHKGLIDQEADIAGGTPADFAAFMNEERTRWGLSSERPASSRNEPRALREASHSALSRCPLHLAAANAQAYSSRPVRLFVGMRLAPGAWQQHDVR